MPLSTSNSKYQRNIPEQSWLKIVIVALAMAAITLVAWEALARKMHHTAGTYQSGMIPMWAYERRELDVPKNDIRVVIIGSSRILWASDLDILSQELGTRPQQLALPGTSPAIFLEDILIILILMVWY